VKLKMKRVAGVRCRYCVDAHNFLEMVREVTGPFICYHCGHAEQPEDSNFECKCHKCWSSSRSIAIPGMPDEIRFCVNRRIAGRGGFPSESGKRGLKEIID